MFKSGVVTGAIHQDKQHLKQDRYRVYKSNYLCNIRDKAV